MEAGIGPSGDVLVHIPSRFCPGLESRNDHRRAPRRLRNARNPSIWQCSIPVKRCQRSDRSSLCSRTACGDFPGTSTAFRGRIVSKSDLLYNRARMTDRPRRVARLRRVPAAHEPPVPGLPGGRARASRRSTAAAAGTCPALARSGGRGAEAARAPATRSRTRSSASRSPAGRRRRRDGRRSSASRRRWRVVTGQQAGLFGGPLYVLYKALGALKTARLLEAKGRPAVAVFWVAVRRPRLRGGALGERDRRGRPDPHSALRPADEPIGQPAWKIFLDETIAALVAELGQVAPRQPLPRRDRGPGGRVLPSRPEPLRRVRPPALRAPARARRARPFRSRAEGALRPAPRPRDRGGLPHLAPGHGGGEGPPRRRLPPAGAGPARLPQPVRLPRGRAACVRHGQRPGGGAGAGPQDAGGGGRSGSWRRSPRASAPACSCVRWPRTRSCPPRATWAGPAEIAYHAQIGPSYAHFGLPRPVLLPRPSLTLVEPAQARALEAEQLKLTDLEADPEGLVSQWAREAYPDVEAAFARTREAIEREMADGGGRRLAALDPTLRAAADAARGRTLHQVETLHEKSIRALKKRDQHAGGAAAPHAGRALPRRLVPGARARLRGHARPPRPRPHPADRGAPWTPSPADTR